MPIFPNIHILGIQGSGKGTQSALLVEKYRLSYVSSGNLFRERASLSDDFANSLGKQLRTGRLLDDSYLFQTVEHYLETHSVSVGLLGDGVIRSANQHYGLLPIWKKFHLDTPFLIHITLDEPTAMQRIIQRQQDAHDPDKIPYHKIYSGKLVQRTDDNPRAIHERFAQFHTMTSPVINLFEQKNRCLHIEGNAPIEQIHTQICQRLEELYPSLCP